MEIARIVKEKEKEEEEFSENRPMEEIFPKIFYKYLKIFKKED